MTQQPIIRTHLTPAARQTTIAMRDVSQQMVEQYAAKLGTSIHEQTAIGELCSLIYDSDNASIRAQLDSSMSSPGRPRYVVAMELATILVNVTKLNRSIKRCYRLPPYDPGDRE